MDVAVIGAGRVGTAVAVLLRKAGHRITAIAGRDATRARAARYLPGVPMVDRGAAARTGEIVLIAVPDDAIVEVALGLAQDHALHEGQWVAHVSGATGLDALAGVRALKARPLAIHPLQTFPDVEGAIDRIPGCWIAITADDEDGFKVGEDLAKDLQANPFRLDDAKRPLYHAAAVFASNYVIAATGIAEELFAEAGVPRPVDAMVPLARASLENVARLGPAQALTGPAVRGDAGTIGRNLQALSVSAPSAVRAYVELARVALELGTRGGRLSGEARARVEEVLARWT
jgi:predicted short-subunit dehydrogenase-like oxidoreductase (DUF2520 family)